MSEQTIITVSREFGSAGHEIAEKIASDLGLKFYDRGMLDEIARENLEAFRAGRKYTENLIKFR